MTERYSMEELSRRARVTPRTIRSYVAEGLLPPPEGSGRGATYGRNHLDRLKVIRILRRARDLPLHKVRILLQSLTGEQIGLIADGTLRVGALVDTDEDQSTEDTAEAAQAPPEDLASSGQSCSRSNKADASLAAQKWTAGR